MTIERPKRPASRRPPVTTWVDFLRARIREERESTEAAACTVGDGTPHWWDLSEAGGRRFGVLSAGRLFASILTGRGHFADHETALHLIRNQPLRVLDDLDAKARTVDLLAVLHQRDDPAAAELLPVVQGFAASYIDHPDHPDPEGDHP
ncbi:DUF6221 family protein [Streptomyces sp. NPDC097619]|uniref:DUF6221 family protein n=1 Tax=Streptomyces sp. NPDC097619 TaxID=3157228 RepID=UPI00331E6569